MEEARMTAPVRERWPAAASFAFIPLVYALLVSILAMLPLWHALSAPQPYDDFVVGNLAWLNATKDREFRAFAAFLALVVGLYGLVSLAYSAFARRRDAAECVASLNQLVAASLLPFVWFLGSVLARDTWAWQFEIGAAPLVV